jgi:hypothetical protein
VADRERPLIHALQTLGVQYRVVRVESVETRYWRTRFSRARGLEPPTF